MTRMYFVVNARMPSEKAHGIHIAKMCEAFIECGIDVVLVVPSRSPRESLKEFYNLRVDVPVVRLPSIVFKRYKRFKFVFMGISFMISYSVFLWWRKLKGEKFILYTIDLDRYSSSLLALIPAPLFTEMHGGKPHTLATRLLFWRLRGVIATNTITAAELKQTFPHASTQYIVEPNGVDKAMFVPQDKVSARQTLGLPLDARIVLYAGRLFEWKGLEILPRAAVESPHIRWQVVGGTRDEFASLVPSMLPANLYFVGSKPHSQMPQWMSAADAVLVIGTKRDEQSYKWTSPMKLFEYLLIGRPIVAADTPALREIVSAHEAFLYKPDDVHDLAQKVIQATSSKIEPRVAAAQKLGERYSWRTRSRHIIKFIQEILTQ